jgi:hypothetical protein
MAATQTLTATVVGEISTLELRFFGLIGRATHPVMQNIWINGFFFENRLHWQFEIQNVPVSKTFDHALFGVIEAITLYCSGVPRGVGGFNPPSEIPKLGQIPRSVENKSVTT